MNGWDFLLILAVILGVVGVAVLAVVVVLLVKLFRMLSVVRNPAMPMEGKAAFWAAVIYTISPLDLLPDPIYLDDVGILVAAIAYVSKLAQQRGLLGRDEPQV